MKYCPCCGSEFFDDIEKCIECERSLVDEKEWKKIESERTEEDKEVFVKVKTVDDRFEADTISDALEKEGVPVLVRNFQDTSFDGIFVPQKGWGIVLVPEQYREKAVEIIKNFDLRQQ